ncbi:MAG: secretin N-terminal domain-containing protein [bacterium]
MSIGVRSIKKGFSLLLPTIILPMIILCTTGPESGRAAEEGEITPVAPTHPPQGRGAGEGEDSALSIRDMDINTLLKALAIKYNVNIVNTPEVSGRISLNLKRASLEDTLTAIARIMGLVWTKEGTIYILSPDKSVQASQEKSGQSNQQGSQQDAQGKEDAQKKEEPPKSVKVFRINYADLKEITKVVQWSFEKARITAYPQEGMLLVESTEKELPAVEHLIHSLDVPPKQALIEAQILEINLGKDQSYGIDWGGTFSQGQNTDGRFNSPGSWGSAAPKAGDTSSQFLFGIARPHFYLKLSALEKKDDVKTLAKPRIMVLDGKSAQILIGGKLGYYLTTSTETSTLQSVEFLDIGIQLQLTPHITEDGNILMDIHPEVSDGSLSSGLPTKTTTSVTTSIMVKAGETVFIGGLIRSSEIKARERLPVLGRIPLLGTLLFSRASTQNQRKELVVLLTPRLVTNAQESIKNIHEGRENIGDETEETGPEKTTPDKIEDPNPQKLPGEIEPWLGEMSRYLLEQTPKNHSGV